MPLRAATTRSSLRKLNRDLRAVVHEVRRLTPTIVEVVLRAPVAARRFEPGQFYRMQNFETLALRVPGTTLAMEGLALTGAWVDREKGLISVIALEMGGSADLSPTCSRGEPVILMGPTGTPTEIPHGETVVLAGGGLGNAVLFSIGRALRAAGSKVLYFAGYKRSRRPLQGRGHRGGFRRGRLVLRRGARFPAAAAAGPQLRRQHRAGDAGLRVGRARRAADPVLEHATASSPSAPTA